MPDHANMRLFALLSACALLLGALHAQTLTVANSGAAPADSAADGGTSLVRAIGAFDLSASGGNVTVTSIMLTTAGSGDWTSDIDQTDGVQLWRDDGDLTFNPSDTLVGQGPGANPTVTIGLGAGVIVSPGSPITIWVVVHVSSGAGASIPETFQISIVSASDVVVSGPATVVLGSPLPQSSTLSVVIFFVSSFIPTQGGAGQPITITGSGFTSPISVTIDGYPCPGTATITSGGTQITGLSTPDILAHGTFPIVLSTGLLGPRTLTQTFSKGKSGFKSDGLTCNTGDDSGSFIAIAALCLVLTMMRALSRRGIESQ